VTDESSHVFQSFLASYSHDHVVSLFGHTVPIPLYAQAPLFPLICNYRFEPGVPNHRWVSTSGRRPLKRIEEDTGEGGKPDDSMDERLPNRR